MYYVEYALGSVSNRNQVIEIQEFNTLVGMNTGKEIYRSMFLYHEDIVPYLETNKTVIGFDGLQAVDKLVIDIDYHKSPLSDQVNGEKTIEQVKKVVETIHSLNIRPEHYNIWFSGTGFHIHLANVYGFKEQTSKKLSAQVRSTMARDFGADIDLIYDPRRLIRSGFSYNFKSKRYKVPIGVQDLDSMSYESIKNYARKPVQDKATPITHEELLHLEPMDMSRKNIVEVRKVYENTSKKATRFISCAQHIYNAGHVDKKRHRHLLALAAIWHKKLGHPKPAVLALARTYVEQMEQPLPMDEVNRIVTDAIKNDYNFGCNHPDLVPYCDSKCTLYRYKDLDETTEILSAKSMIENLAEFYQTDYTDRSFDMQNIFPFMKKPHLFTTGQLITLIGDTGLGKTALIQYIITRIKSLKCLFLSLEVDEQTMSRRFMQAALGMTKQQIEIGLTSKNMEMMMEAEESIKHIQLVPRSPDIQELPSFVANSECKVIVIDTIDRIPAKYAGKDDLARQEVIANALKDMAMKEDVIVIAIHHISKYSSTRLSEGQKLDVHSGKGNSSIEQKSDQYIAFESVDGDASKKKRTVRSLKARDESMFELALKFNYETFTFDKRS